jgi:IS5 family transposase
MATIKAVRKLGMLKAASTDWLIVDMTVMLKAVAHPTDSRLLEKSRQHLVKLPEDNSLILLQSYNREAPRIAKQIGRFARAKQFRRMKRWLRTLKSMVGRGVSRHRRCTLRKSSASRKARPGRRMSVAGR